MYYLCVTILYLLLHDINCADLETTYYEQLILKGMTNAKTYQFPTSKEEFKKGVDSTQTKDYGTFDFIIVGAGSAGNVLATRLSECNCFKILLIEAGGEEDDFSKIPAMWFYPPSSEKNWGYFTTPQKNCCLEMNGQKCLIAQGKVIGGSSAINGMMYVRGNPDDYDTWAKLGNDGWAYKDCLPYFIKSENSQINGDKGYHGKGGLLDVQYATPTSPLFSNFINGTLELNGSVVDYNGRRQIGAAQLQLDTINGRRQSTTTAFLNYARARKNLKVISKALATKIIIDKNSKTAKGIEFVTGDMKFKAYATKELIISAGAINSPQLLMLSGIGPKDHLKEMAIDVIADLPVGKNLLEHPLFPGLVLRTNYNPPNVSLEDLIQMYIKGYGPLTKSAGGDGISFIYTGTGPKTVPNVECVFIPPNGLDLSILPKTLNYNSDVTNEFWKKVNSKTDIIILLILLHEKSRGRVTLNSKNPIDFPNIDVNLFSKQEDVDALITATEYILRLSQTEAFKKINATPLDMPICTQFPKTDKKFWNCVIRSMSFAISHLAGTTAMGPNPKTSVVDKYLKVHGLKKLRVVDAGVIPATISGHTNAPTIMIAEKIVNGIQKEHNCVY